MSIPIRRRLSRVFNIVAPGHTERFNIDVTWPCESGDDDLDTYWGNLAYNYKLSHPNMSCITISAEIRVNQETIGN